MTTDFSPKIRFQGDVLVSGTEVSLSDLEAIRALVFGGLAKIAAPVVEDNFFHLYWDAKQLQQVIHRDGGRFWFFCARTGTFLVPELGVARRTFKTQGYTEAVEVTVEAALTPSKRSLRWVLKVEDFNPEGLS